MKTIHLKNGGEAVVDDEDFAEISRHSWTRTASGYAYRRLPSGEGKHGIFMHRAILPPPPGLEIDHINHDKLDNRRSNLRACTHRQNMRNKTVGSGLGVTRHSGGKWQAGFGVRRKYHYLGLFKTAEQAAEAVRKFEKEYEMSGT